MLLNKLLHYFLFGTMMFFAAGAPPVVGAGEGEGGGDPGDLGGDFGGEGELPSDPADPADVPAGADETDPIDADPDDQPDQKPPQKVEDPETSDFKGQVSRRLLALKKEAPELTQIFQKYPKIQEQIEASFRRDMAYRELYPTLAEARQMREQFPNGLQDVESLLGEVNQLSEIDNQFYNKNAEGVYEGHAQLLDSMFREDREAAVSLFKTLPKEWARLDRESYNEVMAAVVGSTLAGIRAPQYLQKIANLGKDNPQIKELADELLETIMGFSAEKPQPSEQDRKLQADRAQFAREKKERDVADRNNFRRSFLSESGKVEQSVIKSHPSIKTMLAQKNISESKKVEIVSKVKEKIKAHLKASGSFMKSLNAAHNAGKLQESLDVIKKGWSYPWVLNKFVRQVLNEETPNLVRQNREKGRPTTQVPSRKPAPSGERKERTAPYQEGEVWYKKDGTRFTISEILRGLHEQA